MAQTLEEAAQSYLDKTYNLSYERTTWQKLHEKTFIAGADFQAQTMYSEEEVKSFLDSIILKIEVRMENIIKYADKMHEEVLERTIMSYNSSIDIISESKKKLKK
jgi:cell division septum initiation protein DivIVA